MYSDGSLTGFFGTGGIYSPDLREAVEMCSDMPTLSEIWLLSVKEIQASGWIGLWIDHLYFHNAGNPNFSSVTTTKLNVKWWNSSKSIFLPFERLFSDAYYMAHPKTHSDPASLPPPKEKVVNCFSSLPVPKLPATFGSSSMVTLTPLSVTQARINLWAFSHNSSPPPSPWKPAHCMKLEGSEESLVGSSFSSFISSFLATGHLKDEQSSLVITAPHKLCSCGWWGLCLSPGFR